MGRGEASEALTLSRKISSSHVRRRIALPTKSHSSARCRDPMKKTTVDQTEQRHPGSRVLHGLDRWASRPTLAVGVVIADVVWVLFSVIFGFPSRLETVFQTLAAATTLAMVFVIQHTKLTSRRSPSASSMRSFAHPQQLTTR
jgi:hypothetical protein